MRLLHGRCNDESEGSMTPTNKLRFVERQEIIHGDVTIVRFLQQWWEWEVTYPTVNGEWRDVPIEKEQS